MNLEALPIEGMFNVWWQPFTDNRGTFRRHFCEDTFMTKGINFKVKQGNISENPYAGTLRGFHYQVEPFQEQKILTVLSGELWNVTVDLRKDSSTYLQHIAVKIVPNERKSLLIPAGTANAFLTLENNTLVHYYMSENFVPDSYRGFHYNDPHLAIVWPSDIKYISERDEALPSLKSLGFIA